MTASITPAPYYDIDIKRDSDFLVLVEKRGGGGVYTGTLATGPPSPIYAKHTTVNGSRPGFIVICILAGLIFFSILGGGYWWYRRRRRLASGITGRYSSSNRGGGGIFGAARKSMSRRQGGTEGGGGAGAWTTLDGEEDAFDMAPSTNVSMMDLNDQANRPHHGHGGAAGLGLEAGYGIGRKWNPVYAASGDSINFTDTTLPTLARNHHHQEDEDDEDDDENEGEEGMMAAIYTSVTSPTIHHTLPYEDGSETVSIAVSTDAGLTWQKEVTSPILKGPPSGEKVTGFRDPSTAPMPSIDRLLGRAAGQYVYGTLSGGFANRIRTTFSTRFPPQTCASGIT